MVCGWRVWGGTLGQLEPATQGGEGEVRGGEEEGRNASGSQEDRKTYV